MSQENVEIVRRFFEALGTAPDESDENVDTWERLTSEDVVYVEDPRWPGSDTYEGREAVKACWEAYAETLGVATTISLREIHDAANHVVAVVTVAGRTRESDVPYEHTWAYVCEADADRLTYFRAHFDPKEAFEAAGLSE
jgi:ketosteroid isomerase-like protein